MLDQLHMSALCRCFVFLFRHITNVVTPVNEVTKYLYLLILSVQFQWFCHRIAIHMEMFRSYSLSLICDYELWLDYGKAGEFAKEYSSTKGPGTTVKPQNHLFFRKLSPIVQRTLDKCVRENGFM